MEKLLFWSVQGREAQIAKRWGDETKHGVVNFYKMIRPPKTTLEEEIDLNFRFSFFAQKQKDALFLYFTCVNDPQKTNW